MKKQKKYYFNAILLIFLLVSLVSPNAFATNENGSLQNVETTEEYQEWLNLSDEEKENVIEPRKYEVLSTTAVSESPLYKVRMLGASLSSSYSLRSEIAANLAIRNQGSTQECWTFATLSSLETNLALANLRSGTNTSKVYDYSERHMDYATSKTFLNNVINSKGYNREVGTGGTWYFAESYLASGMGAVNEEDLTFKDSEEKIEISSIQNKTVQTQLYDTIDFANYNAKTGTERTEIINQIKQHIQNYGSVYAGIHGSGIGTCVNLTTGGIYCSDISSHTADHAVSIIGWDDNYSISNFLGDSKPTSNGAWIIRNSWGEKLTYNKEELKQQVFTANKQQCIANGWNSAADIPDEILTQNGYTIEGDNAYFPVGDEGFMYVSYEDCNIASSLYGIVKATDTVNYDNIYQYDYYYPYQQLTANSSKIILADIFNKKTSGTEYLTQVSIYAPETYTCKVYVNPNGTAMDSQSLQLVTLQAGESETFNAGYHTLEFAEPIEIKSSSFVVAIEVQGNRSGAIEIKLEGKDSVNPQWDMVEVENGKCFVQLNGDLNNTTWYDLGTLATTLGSGLGNYDSTIKAFTVNSNPVEDKSEDDKTEDKKDTEKDDNKTDTTTQDKETDNNKTETATQDKVTDNDKTDTTTQDKVTDNNKNDTAEEEIAKNSDLSNATGNVKNVKAYFYTDKTKQEYTLINIEIDNITRTLTNDSVEYYYYLSANGSEKNINDWIKISEVQVNGNDLQYTIDSRNVANYSEIYGEDVLYLYIKEVAKKGESQSVTVSNAINIEVSSNIDTYLDDTNVYVINTSNVNTSTNVDNTTATGSLPQTGATITIIALIVIVLAIGIYLFARYMYLSKYIK